MKKSTTIYNFYATINNRQYVFNCYAADTRSGFKHVCYCNGTTATAYYYNRTWESFRFESVIISCLNEMFWRGAKDFSKSKRGRTVKAFPTYQNKQTIAEKINNKDMSNTDIVYDPALVLID